VDNVLLSVQNGQVVILSGRATFYMQTMGENPPTRANHPPTPGISPKWVNRLFFRYSVAGRWDCSHSHSSTKR